MKTLISDLRADRRTYVGVGALHKCPGFWIIAVHRLGEWAYRLPRGVRLPVWLLYRLLHLPFVLFNIELWAGPGGSKLGPGMCLTHPNNVYFGPGVNLGANCLIHHEVTMGTGSAPGTPTLGDGVVVGANCVVSRNIAPGTVILPAANRYIARKQSPTAQRMDAAARPENQQP